MTTQTETSNLPVEMQRAAALSMLATHCAVCRRDLRDPVSVELGIGPECRKKYGFDVRNGATPEAYERAKVLVYKLALAASADRIVPADVLIASDELQELGFVALANILVKRNAKIAITVQGDGRLLVKTPYDPNASREFYRIKGNPTRDARGKFIGYTFPASFNHAAYAVMKTFFAGVLGVGPRGPFVVAGVAA